MSVSSCLAQGAELLLQLQRVCSAPGRNSLGLLGNAFPAFGAHGSSAWPCRAPRHCQARAAAGMGWETSNPSPLQVPGEGEG